MVFDHLVKSKKIIYISFKLHYVSIYLMGQICKMCGFCKTENYFCCCYYNKFILNSVSLSSVMVKEQMLTVIHRLILFSQDLVRFPWLNVHGH